MPVKRTQHKTGYSVINNVTLRDNELSLSARGLLVYMLSFKDNWDFRAEQLTQELPCGRDAVYRLLKELENYGYLERKKIRGKDGQLSKSTYTIYECPQTFLTDNATLGKPAPGNPNMENQGLEKPTIKKEGIKKNHLKEVISTGVYTTTDKEQEKPEKRKWNTKYGGLPSWAISKD